MKSIFVAVTVAEPEGTALLIPNPTVGQDPGLVLAVSHPHGLSP